MSKKKVSVVIVTYNSADEISRCLTSVYAEAGEIDQEVVVVDNQSKDDTVKIIQDQFPQVNLVLPGENLGFAKGVNFGVKSSEGEYVLLLNPDTEIRDQAVEKVYHFAQENPQYGFYGGRTLTPEGELEPSSCWGAPTLWSMMLFAFGFTTLAPRNPILDPESLGKWARDSVREVGVITGCFLFASRKIWDELGGLDERYFMYGEDADLAMRARKAGYRPVICPSAEIVHEVGMSSETPVHKTLLLYRGKASLVRTHWHGISQRMGLFSLAAGAGIRAFASKVIGRSGKGGSADRWQTVWKERHTWLKGYDGITPEAKRA